MLWWILLVFNVVCRRVDVGYPRISSFWRSRVQGKLCDLHNHFFRRSSTWGRSGSEHCVFQRWPEKCSMADIAIESAEYLTLLENFGGVRGSCNTLVRYKMGSRALQALLRGFPVCSHSFSREIKFFWSLITKRWVLLFIWITTQCLSGKFAS